MVEIRASYPPAIREAEAGFVRRKPLAKYFSLLFYNFFQDISIDSNQGFPYIT
jgi:hypothetical protein